MKELDIFLKALKSLNLEEGKYISRIAYYPTSVNAIKNYQLEVYVLNKGKYKLIANISRNHNTATGNQEDLYVDIIAEVLKYYGIK